MGSKTGKTTSTGGFKGNFNGGREMKSVLISIQPYWAFLIVARIMGWDISQEKTIEVRKDYPKDKEWNSVTHIYCSKDRKSFNRIPKQFQPFMKRLLGKVIGSFVCDKIEEFHEHELSPSKKFYEFEKARLDLFLKESCLSYNEVCDYRRNLPYYKPLYAWHISDLKIYDKPKDLGEFKNLKGDPIKNAYQSWGYINE